MSEKKQNGGAGRGQGRKPLPEGEKKVRISPALAPDVVAHIKSKAKQAQYLEELVRRDMEKKRWAVLSVDSKSALAVCESLEEAQNYVEQHQVSLNKQLEEEYGDYMNAYQPLEII